MIYMVITFKDYEKVACVAYYLFQYSMLFDETLLISPSGDNTKLTDLSYFVQIQDLGQ